MTVMLKSSYKKIKTGGEFVLTILFTNRTKAFILISLYYTVLMFLFFISLDVLAVPLKPDAYWNFDDGTARDSSNRRLHGTFHGKPLSVKGVSGKALKFVGGQGIKIPDSRGINTGGPFSNRTVGALFYCENANQTQKQVIFEAGGITKGLAIYVYRSRGVRWCLECVNYQLEWCIYFHRHKIKTMVLCCVSYT